MLIYNSLSKMQRAEKQKWTNGEKEFLRSKKKKKFRKRINSSFSRNKDVRNYNQHQVKCHREIPYDNTKIFFVTNIDSKDQND